MKYLILILISATYIYAQDCPTPFTSDTFKVVVVRVLDGDTFEYLYQNEPFKVRILELDTYESRRGKKFDKQDIPTGLTETDMIRIGKAAKHFADSVLTNQEVTLVRDKKEPNFDVYGRILRKVYIKGILFSDLMKEKGYDSRR